MFLRGLFISVRIETKHELGIFSPILLSDPSTFRDWAKRRNKKSLQFQLKIRHGSPETKQLSEVSPKQNISHVATKQLQASIKLLCILSHGTWKWQRFGSCCPIDLLVRFNVLVAHMLQCFFSLHQLHRVLHQAAISFVRKPDLGQAEQSKKMSYWVLYFQSKQALLLQEISIRQTQTSLGG